MNLDETPEEANWIKATRYPFPKHIDTPEKIKKYLNERLMTVEEFKETSAYKLNKDDYEVLQDL